MDLAGLVVRKPRSLERLSIGKPPNGLKFTEGKMKYEKATQHTTLTRMIQFGFTKSGWQEGMEKYLSQFIHRPRLNSFIHFRYWTSSVRRISRQPEVKLFRLPHPKNDKNFCFNLWPLRVDFKWTTHDWAINIRSPCSRLTVDCHKVTEIIRLMSHKMAQDESMADVVADISERG